MEIQKCVGVKQHTLEKPLGQKKKEIKKYFETNKNRNTAYQDMGCNQKSVLKKKIVVKNIKKKERTQIT